MLVDVVLGFVLVGGTLLGAIALAALSCWSRAGRTEAARWWVSQRPLVELAVHPHFEGFALVLMPVFAQLLVVLAIVFAVGPRLEPLSGLTLIVALFVMLIQCIIFVIAHALTWGRVVMPLWVYPAWLRETRRRERDQLPVHLR